MRSRHSAKLIQKQMKNKLYLGIDTSNYTTSVALVNDEGKVLLNHKRILSVKEGERGLRQSDAVFQHIKNTEEAAAVLRDAVSSADGEICVVGVSATPTYAKGSYMPCFMAGLSQAQMISASLGIPLYTFCHQAGHIMAALYSADAVRLTEGEFAAFHVSGGTTDIIKVTPDGERIILPENIGGTLDINAGQAIDRAGVMMGLGFPAGREMEKLALEYRGKAEPPVCCVKGLSCNLSGLENKAAQLYEKTGDKTAVASYVLSSVRATLQKLLANLYEEQGNIPVVFAGGVMSCRMLHDSLAGDNRYFADPAFASDNAAGIALLTYFKHTK